MVKVMFVCHGNICRSPMAEFVFRDIVEKNGRVGDYTAVSSATSTEEIGNPVHIGTAEKLKEQGISCAGKYAVRLAPEDLDQYDYFIGMDQRNVANIRRILGGTYENRVFRLMDVTGRPGDIADPWYTGDFEKTYGDIYEGCMCLFHRLEEKGF